MSEVVSEIHAEHERVRLALGLLGKVLRDSDLGDGGVMGGLRCVEADALLRPFAALGWQMQGEALLAAHAKADDDEGDEHHDIYLVMKEGRQKDVDDLLRWHIEMLTRMAIMGLVFEDPAGEVAGDECSACEICRQCMCTCDDDDNEGDGAAGPGADSPGPGTAQI